LQELITQAHKEGVDLPDKVKEQLKASPIGKQLEIDNRMSLREKQKAQERAKQLADEEFTKQTGIRNKAEDYSLENMMRKFDYDMKVIEKKHNKLRQENRDDIDLDELTVSEDEFNDEESKKFKDFIK
jgi:SOS-response transcriptional repressor LexA